MARTSREVHLPVPPDTAYMLAHASGCELPSFELHGHDPPSFKIRFGRSFGWSNPIDVDVAVWQSGPQQSTIRYDASIMALADPFNFMDKNLDRFQQHLMAHHQAWLNQCPPPPPPTDSHSPKVNLIIIGVVFGFFGLMALLAVIIAAL